MGVGRAFWLRLLAVAVFDALAIVVATSFAASGAWGLLVLMVLAIVLVNVAYLTPRFEAARWLTPGLILMAFFVVFPVLYTSYVSLTNWRTGNVLTKEQAIGQIERREVQSDGISETGDLAVYRDASARLALVVAIAGDDTTLAYAGLVTEAGDGAEAFSVPDGFDIAEPPAGIEGFELLTRLALTGEARRLEGAIIALPDGRTAKVETLSSYRIVTGGKRFVYDAATDTLYDTQADRTCASGQGAFVCNDVPQQDVSPAAQASEDAAVVCKQGRCDNVPLYGLDASLPGWRAVVGGDNYVDLFTEARIRAPFCGYWPGTLCSLSPRC